MTSFFTSAWSSSSVSELSWKPASLLTVVFRELFCISWSALSTRNEDVLSDLRLLQGEELLEVLLKAGLQDGGELKFILPTA